MACAPGATAIEISLRCRAMASLLQEGRTSPAPFPSAGRRNLVVRRRRTRPTLGPAARDLVLLPDARLIGEPDLYAGRIEALVLCDLIQAGGETFGEQMSGMNKICYYDCLESAAAITIGAAELCPLS